MTAETPERWQSVEGIIDAVLDAPPEQRVALLHELCGTDRELFDEVLQLLDAIDHPDPRLQGSAVDFAAQLIANPPAEAAPAPAHPEQIGPYRLIQEIGRGGMGTVYLAERSDFRKRVALKLVRPGLHLDERIVRRFREERQILASLSHTHIARLLDGGVTPDGLPYFVMEFIEGVPVDRYCEQHALTIAARLRLFRQICNAVEYAHSQGVVHRDLKPSNILVTADGQAKLLDFGIAKLVAPDRADGQLTHTGHRLMTPDYASPEQVRGEPVTSASDVYSLGVLLFELLTGGRPYHVTTPTPHELERAILEQDPARPSSTGLRELKGDLDAIVLKAMRKEPARRYASAGALAEDLRRYLARLPVVAQPDTWRYRARKYVRRHSRIMGVASGLAVLWVVTMIASAFWIRRSARSNARATVVVAVGSIADQRTSAASEPVRTLADMLATNLARAPGLHVVSTARMYELAAGGAANLDLKAAARRAGATRLLEGTVRTGTRNRVRLVLRTIDVAGGNVLSSLAVEGSDLFELADAATMRLVAEFGLPAPQGSIVDVTTRSEVAYRLYDEGLRAFFRGDHAGAYRLFSAALAEDSTFAMAAFNVARLTPGGRVAGLTALDRALQLTGRVSEREGLIVRAYRAWYTEDPALFAIAESLAVRYPAELEGPLYLGRALHNGADFAGALRHYRRVVKMDSAGFQGHRANCMACVAQNDIISGLLSMDSTEAAEREAINWTRFQPQSTAAWLRLREVRTQAGSHVLLADISARILALDPSIATRSDFIAYEHLPFAQFSSADSALGAVIVSQPDEEKADARWYLTLSLRMQGRLREALAVARGNRSEAVSTEFYLMHEAQVLLEMGRFDAAAALFDTVAAWPMPIEPESYVARHRSWALAHRANALAAAGDTVRLKMLIDSIQKIGARSVLARDRRMHHHARGQLLAVRGDHAAAATEFTRAAYSPTGYTRTNYALARALLETGRPREAVLPLQQALRAGLEGGALYATTTELHELLARAWDQAGVADSARVHYRVVTHAWRNADPIFRNRVRDAQVRLRMLDE